MLRTLNIRALIGLCMCGLLLSGCGGTAKPEPAKATPGAQSVSSDIQAIKDRGVLRAGVKVDVPKFGYKNPQTGKVEGFEIDIAKAVAKKILGDENKLETTSVVSKTKGPLLDNGDVDLTIATFTITEERKKSYNFSDSYFTDGIALLVKKESGFQSLKDLNGKKIGVTQTSTARPAIQAETDKLGIKVSFLEFGTYAEVKAALMAGRVDCFGNDRSVLAAYLDDTTMVLPDQFSPQPYGIATKKTNEGLAALVNATLAELKKSGELDKLQKKWGL
jgi:aspartate/glutamate/glutamine transport system substrate-binding protein